MADVTRARHRCDDGAFGEWTKRGGPHCKDPHSLQGNGRNVGTRPRRTHTVPGERTWPFAQWSGWTPEAGRGIGRASRGVQSKKDNWIGLDNAGKQLNQHH